MDYIFIEGLKVRGKHGVMDIERVREQEFEVSFKLAVGDTSIAAKSEKLADAIDYQPIKEMIEGVIKNQSYYLIETLAETLVNEILKDKRIQNIELTIKKTAVWSNGVPGITITRKR